MKNFQMNYLIGDMEPLKYYEININNEIEYFIKSNINGYVKFSINISKSYNTICINSISDELIKLETNYKEIPYTGKYYFVNTTITHKINIKSINILYWFTNNNIENISMYKILQENSTSYWSCKIFINKSSTELNYLIKLFLADNINYTSEIYKIKVNDIIKPSIKDFTNKNIKAGEILYINLNIVDNLYVNNVILKYWYENEVAESVTLIGNVNYSWKYLIPNSLINQLYYIIIAEDNSENINITQTNIINISIDNESIIRDISNIYATTGDYYIFNFSVNHINEIDNIYIEYYMKENNKNILNCTLKDNINEKIMIPKNYEGNLFYNIFIVTKKAVLIKSLKNSRDF